MAFYCILGGRGRGLGMELFCIELLLLSLTFLPSQYANYLSRNPLFFEQVPRIAVSDPWQGVASCKQVQKRGGGKNAS